MAVTIRAASQAEKGKTFAKHEMFLVFDGEKHVGTIMKKRDTTRDFFPWQVFRKDGQTVTKIADVWTDAQFAKFGPLGLVTGDLVGGKAMAFQVARERL